MQKSKQAFAFRKSHETFSQFNNMEFLFPDLNLDNVPAYRNALPKQIYDWIQATKGVVTNSIRQFYNDGDLKIENETLQYEGSLSVPQQLDILYDLSNGVLDLNASIADKPNFEDLVVIQDDVLPDDAILNDHDSNKKKCF